MPLCGGRAAGTVQVTVAVRQVWSTGYVTVELPRLLACRVGRVLSHSLSAVSCALNPHTRDRVIWYAPSSGLLRELFISWSGSPTWSFTKKKLRYSCIINSFTYFLRPFNFCEFLFP